MHDVCNVYLHTEFILLLVIHVFTYDFFTPILSHEQGPPIPYPPTAHSDAASFQPVINT